MSPTPPPSASTSRSDRGNSEHGNEKRAAPHRACFDLLRLDGSVSVRLPLSQMAMRERNGQTARSLEFIGNHLHAIGFDACECAHKDKAVGNGGCYNRCDLALSRSKSRN